MHVKNETDEILDSEPSTKIKIQRKRPIQHTETFYNPSDNIEESKYSNANALKESEKEASEVEKKYDEGSFCDSLEIGVDGEVSSTDKGKSQIARKLTFGPEAMDQHPKGRYRIISFYGLRVNFELLLNSGSLKYFNLPSYNYFNYR